MGTVPDAVTSLVDGFDHDRKIFLLGDHEEEQLPKVKTPNEQGFLQRQIAADDSGSDALVYELGGLTTEQMGVFEGG